MSYQFDFSAVFDYSSVLLHGIAVTTELIGIGGTAGALVSVFCAWARSEGPRWMRYPVGAYVELIRNTPFLVQLFFVFFGLPSLGLHIGEIQASLLAMTINLGAYGSEIVRAGIQATPRGQREAAASLAMSRAQAFIHVVLRPALQKIWPAFSSQVVIVMLGSAVCSQIAVTDLSFAANFIQGRNFRSFEAYIVATLIYLVLAIALRQVLSLAGRQWIDKRRSV